MEFKIPQHIFGTKNLQNAPLGPFLTEIGCNSDVSHDIMSPVTITVTQYSGWQKGRIRDLYGIQIFFNQWSLCSNAIVHSETPPYH